MLQCDRFAINVRRLRAILKLVLTLALLLMPTSALQPHEEASAGKHAPANAPSVMQPNSFPTCQEKTSDIASVFRASSENRPTDPKGKAARGVMLRTAFRFAPHDVRRR